MANVANVLESVRMTRKLREQTGDFPDALREAYDTVETALTPVVTAVTALDRNNHLTSLGRLAERERLTAPLEQIASRFDAAAASLENSTSANASAVIAEELKPPSADSLAAVVDAIQQMDTVRRFEAEDPVIRNLHVVELARRGGLRDMQVVRHALTAHQPAVTTKDSKWQPLLDIATVSAVKAAIVERRSPQGPNAFTATEYRGLAAQLRKAMAS